MFYRIVAVDFDHTLVNNDQPMPGAKEAMHLLLDKGYKILVFSCNNRGWIEKVLNKHEIPYSWIYSSSEGGGKPVCDAYIDDRGVGFTGDWSKAVEEVLNIEQRRAGIPGTYEWRQAHAEAETGTEQAGLGDATGVIGGSEAATGD